MKRSDIHPMPEYFDVYINKVPDIELSDAFAQSLADLEAINVEELQRLGDKAYAPGKWTVKEVLQHIIDAERIFSYRTLLFAREDKNTPPGFDEKTYTQNSEANKRPIEEISAELILVRKSTIGLFQSFSNETLLKKGMNWKYEMSVLAMGFNILGHSVHHINIIRERYLPLLQN